MSIGTRAVAPENMMLPRGTAYSATAGPVTLVTGPRMNLTPSSSTSSVAEAVATAGSLRSSSIFSSIV